MIGRVQHRRNAFSVAQMAVGLDPHSNLLRLFWPNTSEFSGKRLSQCDLKVREYSRRTAMCASEIKHPQIARRSIEQT
jgi:hypothetical protein